MARSLGVSHGRGQLGGHTPELQAQEAIYFRCLCYSALPPLILVWIRAPFLPFTLHPRSRSTPDASI